MPPIKTAPTFDNEDARAAYYEKILEANDGSIQTIQVHFLIHNLRSSLQSGCYKVRQERQPGGDR
ncbi:unnamed protein product [Amoebophrya sp. A25]|nr:unnamed protein product [Amoebophrya sp. A25]CAD7976775.1 unnamed protein product [Amoebophrya sp. A25]|eukprot:GSA25T00027477001.1